MLEGFLCALGPNGLPSFELLRRHVETQAQRIVLACEMLVLPYSLRAVDGAPVSTPLAWEEVTPSLDPKQFTLTTIRKRLDARGDLAAPLVRGTVKLAPALERLGADLATREV